MRMPKQGDVYRHYKGNYYTVVSVARGRDGLPYVVYVPCPLFYGCKGTMYTAPLQEWLSTTDDHEDRYAHYPERTDATWKDRL